MRITKHSFNGGMVDNRVNFRNDLEITKNSCKELTNARVLGLGGFKRTEGHNKIGGSISIQKDSFIIPYEYKDRDYPAFVLLSMEEDSVMPIVVVDENGVDVKADDTNPFYDPSNIGYKNNLKTNPAWINPKYLQVGYDLYIVDESRMPIIIKENEDGFLIIDEIKFTGQPYKDIPPPKEQGFTIHPVNLSLGDTIYWSYITTNIRFKSSSPTFIASDVGKEIVVYQENKIISVSSSINAGSSQTNVISNGVVGTNFIYNATGCDISKLSSVVIEEFIDNNWSDIGESNLASEEGTRVIAINTPARPLRLNVTFISGVKEEPQTIELKSTDLVIPVKGVVSSFLNHSEINIQRNIDSPPYVNNTPSSTWMLGDKSLGLSSSIKIAYPQGIDTYYHTGEATLISSDAMFNEDMIGRHIRLKQNPSEVKSRISTASTGTFVSTPIVSYGVGALELKTSGGLRGTVYLQRSYTNGSSWEDIYQHTSEASSLQSTNNIIKINDALEQKVLYRVKLVQTGTWSGLSVVVELAHKGGIIDTYVEIIDVSTDGYSCSINIENYATSQDWTDRWSLSEFHKGNYPTCITIHEERLYLAGCKDTPFRFWGSKIGDYFNFIEGVEETDPITFQIATDRFIRILWLQGTSKGLTIGCNREIWSLTSAERGKAVSATNYSINRLANSGCADLSPAMLESKLIFVGADKQTLNEVVYSYEDEEQVVNEISFKARDLFLDKITSITSIIEDGDHVLYANTEGNYLITMTLNTAQQIAGFSRIEKAFKMKDLPSHVLSRPNRMSIMGVYTKGKWYVVYIGDNLHSIGYISRNRPYILSDAIELLGTNSRFYNLTPSDTFIDNNSLSHIGNNVRFYYIFSTGQNLPYFSIIGEDLPSINGYHKILFGNSVSESDYPDDELIDAINKYYPDNIFYLKTEDDVIKVYENHNEKPVFIGDNFNRNSAHYIEVVITSQGNFTNNSDDWVVADGIPYGKGEYVPYCLTIAKGKHRTVRMETLDFMIEELGLGGNTQITNPVIAMRETIGGVVKLNSAGNISQGDELVPHNAEVDYQPTTGVRQLSMSSTATTMANEITPSKGCSVIIEQNKPLPMEIIALSLSIGGKG